MKIIFLDIDGVLNYNGSQIIDEVCLSNLRYIVKETDARIVIISTWKECLDNNIFNNASEKEKAELLKVRNIFYSVFNGDLEILGTVENYFVNIDSSSRCKEISLSDLEGLDTHSDWRSVEIKEWLKKNENVESFVIIDDFNCDYDINYPKNWVRTSWFTKGLTKEDAEKAVNILNSIEK